MAAEVLELLAKYGGSALGAAPDVIDEFNKLFGSVSNVQDKARWLQISLVNLTTGMRLMVDDNWFDSGRFWSQPFGSFGPGEAITFFVCDRDGSVFTGVSGGVGLQAHSVSGDKLLSENGDSWWICTFSNPFVGSTKCLTRWKDFGIKPLWEEMDTAQIVRDARCGCYMKGDKEIVFIFKDPETHW